MVLLEATGGLELPLVAALAAAALPLVVVNPRQVRDFAKATGTLAKTDALDAGVLAHSAALDNIPLSAPGGPLHHHSSPTLGAVQPAGPRDPPGTTKTPSFVTAYPQHLPGECSGTQTDSKHTYSL